ncbi:MAG: hypothetical protein GX587_09900 [Bacteroidales bacterium]|nr:hypothetical protein [Bacteroidales bacterium]
MKGFFSPFAFFVIGLFFCTSLSGQNILGQGTITGNFQTDIQMSKLDSIIGAPEVNEKLLMNSYANLLYTNNNLTVGVRFESYLNPMLGYESAYKGSGIPYRFATYKLDWLEVTAGNFYEQFGNGLSLRTYEDKNLGIDNSLDGARVIVKPLKGIVLKGIVGTQRYYWDKGEGIVRGLDGDFHLNQFFSGWNDSKTQVMLGGSFVSKYQKDQNPIYILPENVGIMAGRLNVSHGGLNISSEYANKINDPSMINNYIYKNGQAMVINASYSQSGFGLLLAAKHIDNMSFRSERDASGNDLSINYLPALTRQHTYSLSGMYPYATQPNGEVGLLAELTYKFKKGSFLGGKYGTTLTLNYSRANELNKTKLNDTIAIGEAGTDGYSAKLFDFGKELYFQDFNIEITKRFSKQFKGVFSYVYIDYNEAVIEGHPSESDPMINAHVGIADLAFTLPNRMGLRTEIQHLYTKQDEGNWASILLEYTIAPKWSFSICDQYNYGNEVSEKQVHYITAGMSFNHHSSRITMAYGKQREGIICVGGVCRHVPASNGLTLTVSSSF